MKIQKVLTLTDGSEVSRNAMRFAVEICRKFGAELYLLSVIDQVPSAIDAEVSQEVFDKVAEAVRAEVANCSGYCETVGTPCKGDVRRGIAHHEIVKYAKEIDADMIVMSTHGRSGLTHILLGSVAEKVVRHAPCPVLTIRPSAKDWDIQPTEDCPV